MRSNREEGNGRPDTDIALYPKAMEDPAILFEVKSCKKFNQMQAGLEKACAQIVNQRYREGMLDDGYERGNTKVN